jgi:hypothetical protein
MNRVVGGGGGGGPARRAAHLELLFGGAPLLGHAAVGGYGGLQIALESGDLVGHAVAFAGELLDPEVQRLPLRFELALGVVQLCLQGQRRLNACFPLDQQILNTCNNRFIITKDWVMAWRVNKPSNLL